MPPPGPEPEPDLGSSPTLAPRPWKHEHNVPTTATFTRDGGSTARGVYVLVGILALKRKTTESSGVSLNLSLRV